MGHEIDVSLSDLVADVRALTPSEAAELVVPDRTELTDYLASVSRQLQAGLRGRAASSRLRLQAFANLAVFRKPFESIRRLSRHLDELDRRGGLAIAAALKFQGQRLAGSVNRLESLNPRAVLERGYTLTETAADGKLITAATQLQAGDEVITQFASGRAMSRVERVEPED